MAVRVFLFCSNTQAERERHRLSWAEARADANARRKKMQLEQQGPRRVDDERAIKEVPAGRFRIDVS